MIEFLVGDRVIDVIAVRDNELLSGPVLSDVARAWLRQGKTPADFENEYDGWTNGYARGQRVDDNDATVSELKPVATPVLTAAANESKFDGGGMIALIPEDAYLDRLALEGEEPRDDLHLTLWYLGDDALDDATRELVLNTVQFAVEEWNPIPANAFGVAHWNPEGENPAWVLNVGDASDETTDDNYSNLVGIRSEIGQSLMNRGFDMPEQHTPWQPHICIAYSGEDLTDELKTRLGPVDFDRVRVAFGREVFDVQLDGAATLIASPSGGGTVPWHKVEGHTDCSDGEWAVVQDDSGEVVGCHASEEAANEQIAALYASEEDDEMSANDESVVTLAVDTETPEVTGDDDRVRVGNGTYMTRAEFERERKWRGTLVVEGVTTGDGREFSANALQWVDKPLIRWQKEGAHGGNHDVTVTVGRADRVWRVDNQIMGEGVLDLENEDGFEIYRRLKNDFAGGISIDADDISDADVEVVWPEKPSDVDAEDDVLTLLFAKPEKVVYHGGRIRAATLVDIPAFVEAAIALVGEETVTTEVTFQTEVTESRAVPRHVTATSDAPWKPTKRFGVKRTAPREAYAWASETAAVLLHHEVEGNDVGAANLTACAAAIQQLDFFTSVIPDDDQRAVYEHLAGHLRDAGLVPPPFVGDEALTAALDVVDDWKPPRLWFENPGLTVPIGITITDQGRVYGHAAQWGECHVGFMDTCVTPPHEDQHPYFMTGEVLCADGSRVPVGQITVGTGHAPLSYRATRAVEHYDNTGCVVADVAVGNDDVGIWVAGAIRPHAESARVHDLRASGRVSGDWRRIGGELRLVGLLGVNVAGFQLKTRARVASGVPQSLVAAGFMSVGNVITEKERDQQALGRVMTLIRNRIVKED